MSPQRREFLGRFLPPIITVAGSVVLAVLSAWVVMTSRVSALEVRVEDRKEDISEIRKDMREVRTQVDDIHRALIGNRNPR